jgi:aspartate carbamoyltransferase catalytic subunit
MSADTFSISASTSSTTKGETLADTAKNIEAMMPDIIVMRHASSGASSYLAQRIKTSVINAGDGTHEHPSQGLLDLMTAKSHKGKIEGLKVAIIGDISHSRVAHSNIIGFSKMGAEVFVSGPATLIPKKITGLGATVCSTIQEAVDNADIVMPLRIQKERQNDPLIPSFREYATFFGINSTVLQLAKPDALVMHPGPINRGVELAPDVADSIQSVILEQVTNGVAIRMALMYLVLGGTKE